MIRVKALSSSKGVIEIYDFIGESFFSQGVTPKRISRELKELGNISELEVRINCPGGSVFDGMAIYNLIKQHKARVTVYVDGMALSMGSVIAMVGDEIIMPANAMMMIHNPWSLAVGDANELEHAADVLRKIEAQIRDIYSERTGNDPDAILEMMNEETWMTGTEAAEMGFADQVDHELEIAACADLDKMKFKNAPDLEAFTLPEDSGASMKPEEHQTMPTKANAPAEPGASPKIDPPAPPVLDEEEITQQALAREATRQARIRELFGAHTADNRELLDTCLQDQACTPESASEKLLAKLGENAPPIGTEIEGGPDARDKFVTGVVAALGSRIGLEKRDRANEFSGMRLTSIARACLKAQGVSITGLSDYDIAGKIMALSTSDFPLITANIANKVLLAAFEEVPKIWSKVAKVGEVPDFKTNHRLTLGSFGKLLPKLPGGEYKHGKFGERDALIKADTKGLMVNLTREMVINDDLGAFSSILQMLGLAAGRTVNADVIAAFAGNAPDGTALFHTDHNNLAGSGAVIGLATIGAGKTAMLKQKDIDGNAVIGQRPSLLMVPAALEDEAMTFVTSETDPSQANSKKPNIYRGTLEVVSDPELDEQSATAWYLLANPMLMPVVEVDFLDGNQTPFVDDNVDFGTDSLQHKVRYDYGTAGVEFRGGWKNPGQ